MHPLSGVAENINRRGVAQKTRLSPLSASTNSVPPASLLNSTQGPLAPNSTQTRRFEVSGFAKFCTRVVQSAVLQRYCNVIKTCRLRQVQTLRGLLTGGERTPGARGRLFLL